MNPSPPPTTNSPSNNPTKPSSGTATLANAVINLAKIKEDGRKNLIDALNTVRGKKALVLDAKLSGPLGQIAEVSLLKEQGVEKIYHLSPGRVSIESKNVIYIVRPQIGSMRCIADHIHGHTSEGQKKEYHIFFVPRRTMICEKVLEEEGVYGDVTIGEYPLDLIPYDDDILSLELDNSYKECFLEGDRTCLFYVARSLMKLQSMFGIVPKIKGKGVAAKLVVDMLLRMRREMGDDVPVITPEIDQLIVIDRELDLITPMCTQLTYEGIIDEVFGIHNGYVDLDPEIAGSQKGGKKLKVPLNSNDKLYSSLRDLNIGAVGPLLNRKAKEIDEYYKQRHNAHTVSQIRDFMKKFSTAQHEHASLGVHTGVATHILGMTKNNEFPKRLGAEQNLLAGSDSSDEYIEECINKQEPVVKVLRLLCLNSLVNNGIKPKQFEFYKREILQSYGFDHLLTLDNLEKLGLLKKQEGKSIFSVLRKNLNLIVEDFDETNTPDINYTYSGYAPLSVRIIQAAFKPGGWRTREDIMRLLPGPSVEAPQSLPEGAQERGSNATQNPVTLVFYIGGITFAELAALRWMSKQEGLYGDIIVGTTKLINGNSFLSSLIESRQ